MKNDVLKREEYKRIQLDLLKAFAKVCEENRLRYILDYGSLLGAIRHKGMVPWDDDIDVSMPREDYDLLMKLFRQNELLFGENKALASMDNDYCVYKPYYNLIDTRTITKSDTRNRKFWYPIWIDIFPMDFYPTNSVETKYNRYIVLRDMIWLFIGNSKSIKARLKKAYIYLHLNKIINEIDNLLINMERKDGKLLNMTTPYGMKDTSCISFYDEYIYADFEGDEYRIPKEYDTRLKSLYGDYMELPPKDSRKQHIVEAYWKL